MVSGADRMKLKGKLTISNPRNATSGYVLIKLEDVISNTDIEVRMSVEDFANALLGRAFQNCELEIVDPSRIGKRFEHMEVVAEMPSNVSYSEQNAVAYEVACKAAPEGWVVSSYFSSQNSFFRKDGKEYCRTQAMRWVDEEKNNGLYKV